MSCIWNIKPEERHCDFCVVERCQDRLPKQSEAKALTQTELAEIVPSMYYTKQYNQGDLERLHRKQL